MKCLAIDDEPLALAQLSDYISRVPFLSLVKPCQDAFEAMKVLSDEDVDLIFVDINMPDLNGLDFIRSLISPPLVIFTTAYSEYAVDGFKLDAVDYLLKPFEFQDLLKAADKARKQFEYKLLEQQSELGNASQVKGDSLFVKSDCRVVRIDINNIRYIEGMSEYVRIFVEGENKPVITLASLQKWKNGFPHISCVCIVLILSTCVRLPKSPVSVLSSIRIRTSLWVIITKNGLRNLSVS